MLPFAVMPVPPMPPSMVLGFVVDAAEQASLAACADTQMLKQKALIRILPIIG
jgi:hypothetical protein